MTLEAAEELGPATEAVAVLDTPPVERLEFDWCRPREAERLERVSAWLRLGVWAARCLFWVLALPAGLSFLFTVVSFVFLIFTLGETVAPIFSTSLGACCGLGLLTYLAHHLEHRWKERATLLVAMADQLRREHRELRRADERLGPTIHRRS